MKHSTIIEQSKLKKEKLILGSMDVVGFDSAVPRVMSDFIAA